MDKTIKEFFSYLIDKHENCNDCKFSKECEELDKKTGQCLCDKAYKSLSN